MTTQTLTFISAIAILGTALFFAAFRLFKTFYLLKEVKTRLNLETEQKEHYKKKLAASPTRQEFIEQSEMATSWRQKHDALEVKFNDIEKINNELHADNVNLESEIDRANEFITEARSIMQRQRLIIEESHWDFDELAKFAEHADKTGTISEYLKVSRRNVLRTPAPIHLFPNPSFKKEDVGSLTPSEETFSFLDNMLNKASETLNERTNEVFGFSSKPTQGIDHQIKSTEGEEKLTHNGLMKQFVEDRLNELEKQTEIDWSKPQPFPKDYRIPKGTECVNLTEGVYGSFIVPELTKVATIESSFNPFVKRLDGKHRQNKVSVNYNDFADKCFNGIDLAPINPTDHPLHPEFKAKK